MDHDQNFKNLILDYPRQALELFAAAEAGALDASVQITPVRQEQLKERLGERGCTAAGAMARRAPGLRAAGAAVRAVNP